MEKRGVIEYGRTPQEEPDESGSPVVCRDGSEKLASFATTYGHVTQRLADAVKHSIDVNGICPK